MDDELSQRMPQEGEDLERHVDLFERRDLDKFSSIVKKAVNLLTISTDYKIIGTAGLKYLKYYSDVDINESYKATNTDQALKFVAKNFKQIFKDAQANPNLYITDFKCGMDSDGEPLRWDKADVKRGSKELKDRRVVSMEDVLLQKTTLKMDLIVREGNQFVEVSNNYFLKLGEYANYFPFDFNKDKILNAIAESYDEYFYASGNLFKGLKRAFAYFKMKDPDFYRIDIKELADFFNSPVGWLYKQYSEIGTIIELLDQDFRKPKLTEVKIAIKEVMDNIPAGEWSGESKIFLKKSLSANSLSEKSVAGIVGELEKAKTSLFWWIQQLTAKFVLKNKSVALY